MTHDMVHPQGPADRSTPRMHELENDGRRHREKTMPTRIANPMRWKVYAGGLAFMLLTIGSANSAEQSASSETTCAEREALLAALVEAHGEVPNATSAKLTEASITIMQARAAGADGRANDAMALYDRLIAELGGEGPRTVKTRCWMAHVILHASNFPW